MFPRFVLSLAVALVPFCSPAAIVVLDYYRFGDDDPGAQEGSLVANPTVDSVGTSDLSRKGGIYYSSNVPFSTVGGASNAFSASLNGNFMGDFSYGTQLTDAQDNFGIEVFVNAGSISGNAGILYNGKAGSTGFGLRRIGDQYQAILGTNPGTSFGSAPVSVGEWIHLALVRDNGISTFYVNGVPSGTSTAVPLSGSAPFRIGSTVGSDGFDGLIDEVRLFTFEPGAFSTSDLLVNQVPEPSLSGGVLLGAALLLSFGRRAHSGNRRRILENAL